MKITFIVDHKMPVDGSFFSATHSIEIDDNDDAQQAANIYGKEHYCGFLSAVIISSENN
ncbi:hypothetical protein OKZ62_001896 [Vibrio navarrensis]|nr:hypothetical protein [Vibrio navarrensis]